MIKGSYVDDFGTCSKTFVSLNLYSNTISPQEMTNQLGLEPSGFHQMGDLISNHREDKRKEHYWSLCSEKTVDSLDLRRHLDWLLNQIWDLREPLAKLIENSCRGRITCFWLSKHGHGGPILSTDQTERLSALKLDCEFDIYFDEED